MAITPNLQRAVTGGIPGDISGDPMKRYIPRRRDLNMPVELIRNMHSNRMRITIPADPREGVGLYLPEEAGEGGPFYPSIKSPATTWADDRIEVGGTLEKFDGDTDPSPVIPGRSDKTPGVIMLGGNTPKILTAPAVVTFTDLGWSPGTTAEYRLLFLKTTGENEAYTAKTSAQISATLIDWKDTDGYTYFPLGWIQARQVTRKDTSGAEHTYNEIMTITWPCTQWLLSIGSGGGGVVPVKITGLHPETPRGTPNEDHDYMFQGDIYENGTKNPATLTNQTIRQMNNAAEDYSYVSNTFLLACPIVETWSYGGGPSWTPITETVYEVDSRGRMPVMVQIASLVSGSTYLVNVYGNGVGNPATETNKTLTIVQIAAGTVLPANMYLQAIPVGDRYEAVLPGGLL